MKYSILTIAFSMLSLSAFSQESTASQEKLTNVGLSKGLGWGEKLLILDSAIVESQNKVDGMSLIIDAKDVIISEKNSTIKKTDSVNTVLNSNITKIQDKNKRLNKANNFWVTLSAALSIVCAGLMLSK